MTLVHPSMQQGYGRKNLIINGDMRVDQRKDNVFQDLSTFAPTFVDVNPATTFVDNNAVGVLGGNTASTFTQGAITGTYSAYRNITGLTVGDIYKVSVFVKFGTVTNFVTYVNDALAPNTIPTSHTEATIATGYSSTEYKELSFVFIAPASGAVDLHIGSEPSETGLPVQTYGTVFIDRLKVTKLASQNPRAYSSDRFHNNVFNPSTTSVSRMFSEQSIRPLNSNPFAARVTVGIAETSGYPGSDFNQGLVTILEGQDITPNATGDLTVSFKFTSNVTGTFPVSVRANVASDSYVHEFTYNVADVEQTISFTFPSSNKFNVKDSSYGASITIGFINGSVYQTVTANKDTWITGSFTTTDACVNWATAVDNYIEVTDLQLEVGSSATDFEYRPYSEELRLCQRYYEKTYDMNEPPGSLNGNGSISCEEQAVSPGLQNASRVFICTKRAVPTVITYSTTTGTPNTIWSSNPAGGSTDTFISSVTTIGTNGHGHILVSSIQGVGEQYMWHETVDAEL